jgi:hypothetical protein
MMIKDNNQSPITKQLSAPLFARHPRTIDGMGIGVGLFPANTLITLLRLHSLAFGFGTFAYMQKTKLPRLTTVYSGKPDTDALMTYMGYAIFSVYTAWFFPFDYSVIGHWLLIGD